MPKLTLSDLPKRYQEQVVKSLGGVAGNANVPSNSKLTSLACSPSKDECKLNKTEAAYLSLLRSKGVQWLGVQNITLKLGDDCRYTPDFSFIQYGVMTFDEVKGFFRDDAKVKIKVAARLFPWAQFRVVKKNKEGWDITPISP